VRPLSVWAPAAARVQVHLDGRILDMTAAEGGWWAAPEDTARPEADYSFSLDGGRPLPDPRSPWQPYGVHGPSRTLDHAAFRWTDAGFQARPLASAVIYELHTGTFTPEGTFEGAIGKLGHLVDLGVTHVELMPVAEFPGRRGWGYDGVDLFAPHHAYGGPLGLKQLVDACHARGLGVLLDVVYNHLGPSGNYLARYGPYFTARHHTPWGEALNLDGPGSDEVRRFLCDNAKMWLRDYHMDGLRLDAIHSLFDQSATHFLEQLSAGIEDLSAQLGRRLVLIAESDLNDPRVVRPRECGGYGFDAQWSDDFHHALHAALAGERSGYYRGFGALGAIAKALRHAYVYEGQYAPHRKRRYGRSTAGLPASRFLAYLQNHDQVGNRAQGERLGHLIPTGRLRAAVALLLLSPFPPMLFQGEEFAASTPFQFFTEHDEELGRAVTQGRQREFAAFGWDPASIPDPQDPATFERSKLRWEEAQSGPGASMFAWYRSLIRLRRLFPSLADARMDRVSTLVDEDRQWLAMQRGPVCLLCNFAQAPQTIPLKIPEPVLLLASSEDVKIGPKEIELPSDAAAVVAGAREAETDAWLRGEANR
jgi:maltooligosyltrehalose trehalohydrolase